MACECICALAKSAFYALCWTAADTQVLSYVDLETPSTSPRSRQFLAVTRLEVKDGDEAMVRDNIICLLCASHEFLAEIRL